MPEDCAINFDHIQTVFKQDLGRLITHLRRGRMLETRTALMFALGCED